MPRISAAWVCTPPVRSRACTMSCARITGRTSTASISVFANESPPSHLKDLVGRISPRPLLLIAAPNTRNGEQLNRDYHAAAVEP